MRSTLFSLLLSPALFFYGNAAIAQRLRLSDHTVKRHVANILLKLDLPTRAAAAALIGRKTLA